MDIDLLKADENLSLIVGHNGGHSGDYTRILNEKLNKLSTALTKIPSKDYNNFVNIKVKDIIKEMYDLIIEGKVELNNGLIMVIE